MTVLAELKPWEAPRCGGRSLAGQEWWGYLTVANYEHVGARVRELLEGYAFSVVVAYEYRGWEPELRAPVWLDDRDGGVRASEYGDGHVGVSFPAGSFVYIMSSTVAEQPRVRFFEPEGHGPAPDVLAWMREADDRLRAPHLAFRADSLMVRDRAPNGGSYWTLFQRLEGAGETAVVLSAQEAAITRDFLSCAREDETPAATRLMERIDRVFPGNAKWLP